MPYPLHCRNQIFAGAKKFAQKILKQWWGRGLSDPTPHFRMGGGRLDPNLPQPAPFQDSQSALGGAFSWDNGWDSLCLWNWQW